MLHVMIMAGGSGTRFWPASRTKMPKQLLQLAGDGTMIQQTQARCDGLVSASRMWVVTNKLQSEEIARQLPRLPADHILVEPCARNTAPCVGLAVLHLLVKDPDAVMLVTPADQVISPISEFQSAVQTGLSLINEDSSRFVLFGIPPQYPATGFGYIEAAKEAVAECVHSVESFKEKPDLETAKAYLASGRYFWNSGIFMWKAQTLWDTLAQHEPTITEGLLKLKEHIGKPTYDAALAEVFPTLKSISIDYAVLERADNCVMIRAPFEWDDAGSWQSLTRLNPQDADENTILGKYLGLKTKGCIIRSSGDHLISTYGVEGLIIVHTPDATLVADASDDQAVKQLVETLKERGMTEYL